MPLERLFAYGTLQLPEVLQALLGRRWHGQPARLVGYVCFRVLDKPYPAIVADAGATVTGTLYSGLSEAELAELDRYEGELYERKPLRVRSGGARLEAFSYVLCDRHRSLLSREAWDLRTFEREHLASYLRHIAGTRRAP